MRGRNATVAADAAVSPSARRSRLVSCSSSGQRVTGGSLRGRPLAFDELAKDGAVTLLVDTAYFAYNPRDPRAFLAHLRPLLGKVGLLFAWSASKTFTHYGLRVGLRHARKHLGWALDTAAHYGRVPAATLKDYVVTEQLVGCFDDALSFIRSAIETGSSKAAFLRAVLQQLYEQMFAGLSAGAAGQGGIGHVVGRARAGPSAAVAAGAAAGHHALGQLNLEAAVAGAEDAGGLLDGVHAGCLPSGELWAGPAGT